MRTGDPRNRADSQGYPGDYDVAFTFARPGFPLQDEYQINACDFLKGTSHLALLKGAHEAAPLLSGALRLDAATDEGNFAFIARANGQGFLATIAVRCSAQNFLDAQRKCFKALAPLLSNWSLQLDIPLAVYQVDLVEVASRTRRMAFTPPFHATPLVLRPDAKLNPDFRGYASLYREALNSNSPVYQYLCYFKIIESVRKRRERLGGEARARGETFSRPAEVFPSSPEALHHWLDALHTVRPHAWDQMVTDGLLLPETVGKKFGTIIEKDLIPLRTRAAHALFESAELGLSVDDYLSHETVNKWLPVLKCMVRRMLKNEFPSEFLAHLPDPPA